MKKGIFFFVIVFLILFSSFSLAISISGKSLPKVLFEPGKIVTNEYTISSSDDDISLTLNGDERLLNFMELKKVSSKSYLLTINFPNKINIDPGIYRIGLYAQENAGSDSAVGVSLGVEKVLFIHVYTKEKNIEANIYAPSINVGDDMIINLGVESRTYSDISNVNAKINVFDSDNILIGKIDSSNQKLDSLDSLSFKIPFNSENLVQGNYLAVADVSYDELKVQVNDSFDVGKLDLKLVNYPRQIPKGFAQVDIDVKNNWGNSLNNVYAKLVVDGKEIFQTPTINLGAWEQGKLSAIGNFDFPYGDYNSQIILFFEGQSKVEKIKLSIIENEIIEEMNSDQLKSSNYTNTILITTVLIIMLIVIVMLLVKFRHKSKVEDEEEF
jgi:hypothetical protein